MPTQPSDLFIPKSLAALSDSRAAQDTRREEQEASEGYLLPDVKTMTANLAHSGARPGTHGAVRSPSSQPRKSSYERYWAIAMPTLEEDRTPVPSSAGTLARSAAPRTLLYKQADDGVASFLPPVRSLSESTILARP